MIRIFILPVATLLLGSIIADHMHYSGTDVINYPEHLTGAFTGGFGEETCRSCHFDYDLNPDGGALSVSGINESISAGETVKIGISVERKELGAAGFQLSARYEDGSQAGTFLIGDEDCLMFSKSTPDSLQFVQHSSEGSTSSKENSNSWTIRWRAPDNPKGTVVFNVASNAANGDQSEFGDYIYTDEIKVTF